LDLALGVLGGSFGHGMMNDSPKDVALDPNSGALISVCLSLNCIEMKIRLENRLLSVGVWRRKYLWRIVLGGLMVLLFHPDPFYDEIEETASGWRLGGPHMILLIFYRPVWMCVQARDMCMNVDWLCWEFCGSDKSHSACEKPHALGCLLQSNPATNIVTLGIGHRIHIVPSENFIFKAMHIPLRAPLHVVIHSVDQ